MATLLSRHLPLGEAGLAASPAGHPVLLVQRQAAMAASVGDFRWMTLLTLSALPLPFLLQRRPARSAPPNPELPNRHAVHGGPLGARP